METDPYTADAAPRNGATRYSELAARLQLDIETRQLSPGEKLPSVRALCRTFRASPATVTHALHLLEDAGLVEARPRSGFYVRRPDHHLRFPHQTAPTITRPLPVALSSQRALMREFHRSDHDDRLCRALIDPDCYPGVALQRIMTLQARRDPGILARASVCGGSSALREQLARRAVQLGCHWDADEVLITHGETEAVHTFLRLFTKPGDVVAIQSPSHMALLNLLDTLGVQVLEIPAHPVDGLSVDALAFALRREKIAACVLTANFPNPTGSLMSDAAKRRTVDLLAQHGVPLIEDDSVGELYYGKARPLPFKAFDQTGNVYYCADLGFLVGPGISVGFAVTGNQRYAFEYALMAKGEPPPLLFQRTLATFMASGQFEPYLRRLRRTMADYTAAHRAAVEAHFPAETRMAAAPGGILIWVELPHGMDSSELQRRALDQHIRFAPGRLFSLDASFANCMRLNAGHRFRPETEREIATLGRLIREQMAV
ncbi:PLP-dependent aminotransferase family protein [Silvimonas sp. JCM 19000]